MNVVLALKDYALKTGLIEMNEQVWAVNVILDALGCSKLPDVEVSTDAELYEILNVLCDDAYARGILKETGLVYRDLFDTEVMGRIVPRPAQVISKFEALRNESVIKATDWYYQFCKDSNYIRRDRIKQDMQWKVRTDYGELDVTINRLKPEKDPRAITAARRLPVTDYPRCRLCIENEGYAGRINYPPRQNHRVVPITIDGFPWFFQYSPYVCFNEHCICFSREHVPMKIDRKCFANLLDFVNQFPHYFAGSNADLPIVGGSILAHDHFHGGRHTFALENAPLEMSFSVHGFEDITAGVVKWPMSTIRINCSDSSRLLELAEFILNTWRDYTDENVMIFAETNGEIHNTITPIARKKNGVFELDLILRNNLTTPEHPYGLFHSHAEKHNIKKENIGVIESMGMALLPARLKEELLSVAEALVSGGNLECNVLTEKHTLWVESFRSNYIITAENALDIVLEEAGKVFVAALEDTGVFKRDKSGKEAFLRFLSKINATVKC